MSEGYGSDFITIVDEDGTEFELEVLTTLEYNGATYLAVTLAIGEEEPILCAIEDDAELESVYTLIMEQLYEDEEEE